MSGIVHPPVGVRRRVVISTDTKNEADDQFAVAQALLSPGLEVLGIVPTHFGTTRGEDSMRQSREELERVLALLGSAGATPVHDGSEHALRSEDRPVESRGARFIIEEALRTDDRPLHVLCMGPLTDLASALLIEPAIANRVIAVWVGGPSNPIEDAPLYWPEFNLINDVAAANVVLRSAVEVWQIPMGVYASLVVSFTEIARRVAPSGPIGAYLAQQLFDFSVAYPLNAEAHPLSDCSAVAVTIFPHCGTFRMLAPSRYDSSGNTDGVHPAAREIRVYQTIDQRFVIDDCFAKLAEFASARSNGTSD